jgi:hypothetical protein
MVIIQKKLRIKSGLTVMGEAQCPVRALWRRLAKTRPPPPCERRKVNFAAPDRTDWVIDRAQQQATNNYRDYAIVTLFTDTNTGKIAIVAAGVGRGGTIAAGEFLTDPADLAQVVTIHNYVAANDPARR